MSLRDAGGVGQGSSGDLWDGGGSTCGGRTVGWGSDLEVDGKDYCMLRCLWFVWLDWTGWCSQERNGTEWAGMEWSGILCCTRL